MPTPSEALFSEMGDAISKTRNNLMPAIRSIVLALHILSGIKPDEGVSEEHSNFGDNGNLRDELTKEIESRRRLGMLLTRTKKFIYNSHTKVLESRFKNHPISHPFVKRFLSSELSK